MDPLTQGTLGAAAALAVARPEHARWAAALGALSGMAPDLDVLIRSTTDPLLFLEYHRQFTHALAFVPIGALLCTAILSPFIWHRVPLRRAYGYCFVGYATHGALDACTSYGTQLLWPFSDTRVAWNNVSVVDPLFTAVLLACIVVATVRHSRTLAWVGCMWAIGYLLIGVAQRERAESFGLDVAQQRGHDVEFAEAKPAFGSLILWKTIYEFDGRYYVDAVRLTTSALGFAGQSISKLAMPRDLPWLDGTSQQARDLERFRWFSDGYLALDPKRAHALIDIRYSLLPHRIDALWGIQLDPAAPADAHAAFYTARDVSSRHRAELFRLFVGSAVVTE